MAEPPDELVDGAPQRVLGVDPVAARDVGDREEEIADLLFDRLSWTPEASASFSSPISSYIFSWMSSSFSQSNPTFAALFEMT